MPDQWAYTGSNEQWTVTNVSGVQYKILAANGQALTMTSSSNTTLAGLASYTGSTSQLWTFWSAGSGQYYVLNVGQGMALDNNNGGGAGVQLDQWACSITTHQQWTLTATSGITAPVANGTYELVDQNSYALDDPSGGATSVPDQLTYSGANQKWTVTNVSGVQYKLIAQGGNALTSAGSSGALAGLSAYTGATTQLWTFWANGNSWSLINVSSNLALDYGTGVSASNVNQKAWAANTAQTWTLVTPPTSCSISVTQNSYSSYNGSITWQNTGAGTETNPVLSFTLPNGANNDNTQCLKANIGGSGHSISAVSCNQVGTTETVTMTGTVNASGTLQWFYTTQNSSEAAATNVTVTASSCP